MKTCPICENHFENQHQTCPTDGARLIESEELAPGTIVRGKYRIVRKIGRGGMGIVYLADDLLMQIPVALKFLAGDLSRDLKLVRRLRNDARAALPLRHPNVVQIFTLDQAEDGGLFIVMEFVDGPNLRELIDRAPHGLPVEEAVALVRGIACGLAAAHSTGVVHRDIKPENVLLKQASQTPVILDFGIATMAEYATAMSRTRGLMLTPEYAAPEQWQGMASEQLDGRTDMYALGGIFYELLTGQTPYHAHNAQGWMYQHLQGTLRPPSELRPSLRQVAELDELVLSMLERNRDRRMPSMGDFLDRLERVGKAAPAARKTVLEPPPPPAAPSSPASGPASPPDEPKLTIGAWLEADAQRRAVRNRRIAIGVGAAVVLVGLLLAYLHFSHSGQPVSPQGTTSSIAAQPSDAAAHPAQPLGSSASKPTPSGSPASSGRPAAAAPDASPAYTPSVSAGSGNRPAPPASEENGAKSPQKISISPDVATGMLVAKTQPVYPPIAKAARVAGTVVLRGTITRAGTLENLMVVSGHPFLQQAAVDAVKQWRYRPYLLEGRPVEVETTINVVFRLGE